MAALAACGGGKSESDKPGEASAKAAAAAAAKEVTCSGTELTGKTGLPASFPKPSGVTYVKTRQDGPTRVVNAYYSGNLDSAYNAYKSAFTSAGYAVPFNEKEEDDAEVSYSKTGGTTGLVALKAGCNDDNTISIRITSRAE
jgi:hypothetical protein